MTGSTYFEKRFGRSRAKLIYDFDDAIWHFDISEANKKFGWLKNPGKTAKIISYADLVIAGNQYLAEYAKHHNNRVEIIPTTIDADSYTRIPVTRQDEKIVIGWSGSLTTMKHFDYAVPFLKMIKQKFGDKIIIKAIGDPNYRNEELGIRGDQWSEAKEVQDLSTFDIGIMPLPNDEWAKGKCGLKGLQYMALEIPVVISPVGVNTEIVHDGVNGFLAASNEEWVVKISELINSPERRRSIGAEGRKTVVDRYSVSSQKMNYLRIFKEMSA